MIQGTDVENREQSTFRSAVEAFEMGNLPLAEIYCRHTLAENSSSEPAQQLLNAIKAGYGIPESFELSESVLPVGAERFLLIKAWGYGFWSEGHHLAGQLLLAELTGRTPIILWGTNCLFRASDDVDASGHYFQEISPAKIENIPADATFYPNKWSRSNLLEENLNKWEGEQSRVAAQYLFARPETVVVSDFFSTIHSIIPWIGHSSKYFGKTEDELYAEMFQKYLKPVDRLSVQVEQFYNSHMNGRPWVAVHMRGSDKVYENPLLAETNAKYFDFIDRIIELNPQIGVFLMTDTVSMVEVFQKRYPDRLLCTQVTRTSGDVGVHLSGHDGVVLGDEVLIDTLIALKCDYLIGNQESNVSLAIASLKNWPLGFVFLLGASSCRHENIFIHNRTKPKAEQACRLCGGKINSAFTGTVLAKHQVEYFRCGTCGALQTEMPYWLEEAYGPKAEQFDTGKASRTLSNFLLLPPMFEILGIKPDDRCADFGGGTGLFARLMRDIGYNYYNFDKFGSSEFASGFSWNEFNRPLKLVTLFECAEHFVNPAEEWDTIFATNPDFILGSTGIYAGQGADWFYLAPENGQHVFFYAPETLVHIAQKRGWAAYILGGFFLLSRTPLSAHAGNRLVEWSSNISAVYESGLHRWMNDTYACASADNQRLGQLARLNSGNFRIAIDGTFFRFATGISRLWKSLLAEWSVNGFGEYLVVLDRDRTAPHFAGIRYVDIPSHNYADLPADRQMLQSVCDREGCSLFISTYYTTPLTTPAVMMVPDMIPEVMGFDLNDAQWREKHNSINYAQDFIAISHSTKNDLIRFFPEIAPERVTVAHCGTDFRTPSQEQIDAFKAKYGIDRPYFMLSGVKSGYKNALLFFKAFEQFGDQRNQFSIVCTNSLPNLEPEFAACLGEGKIHPLILTDEELQCAYAGAITLAYPSRYEGFGLPVLEAMTCSCPVVTCNNSSIGEVAGDAAIYVDPDNVEEMYAALRTTMVPMVRNEFIRKGLIQGTKFSWRKMADSVEAKLTRRLLS